jgi:3-oxoacyl-[acyl-carrier-protein] synthase II
VSKAYVLDYNIATAYGHNWQDLVMGIGSNKTALCKCDGLNTEHYKSCNAGFIDGIEFNKKESRLMQIFNLVTKNVSFDSSARLLFASTVGEIDLLENSLRTCRQELKQESTLLTTAKKVNDRLNLVKSPIVVSAACASTTSAISCALSMINSGEEDVIVVVAADIVSDFVFSGFTSLLALDNDFAKPFDENRSGLSLGEAVGYLVLVSKKYLEENKLDYSFAVSGAGQSKDANHMTGPSRDGTGLCLAITRAIESANLEAQQIDMISAHGTGTKYNDSTELKAFKKVFVNPKPVFSVKGAIGHTMGSAGLAQIIVTLNSMKSNKVPQTVGCDKIDSEAQGWVGQEVQNKTIINSLVVNAGFGGVNAAIILEKLC